MRPPGSVIHLRPAAAPANADSPGQEIFRNALRRTAWPTALETPGTHITEALHEAMNTSRKWPPRVTSLQYAPVIGLPECAVKGHRILEKTKELQTDALAIQNLGMQALMPRNELCGSGTEGILIQQATTAIQPLASPSVLRRGKEDGTFSPFPRNSLLNRRARSTRNCHRPSHRRIGDCSVNHCQQLPNSGAMEDVLWPQREVRCREPQRPAETQHSKGVNASKTAVTAELC
mmetsp:Transcript_51796/g.150408  ORF Transcript_51796/g.150408 Transcript_51796/m.150408 type:complete len:233 (+) Transcript_51796:1267-1965(+)